ncbi:hypothetical protein FSP39_000868 [Pinctada imbricata]|uniref:Hexosyltransferase n=1 Tax=Pinctada imbricata TaxID=66713 RepID=A0AA89C5C1_PINIB|nr:hypothetical protein FSP39_000868 [Pinctada imbricata]
MRRSISSGKDSLFDPAFYGVIKVRVFFLFLLLFSMFITVRLYRASKDILSDTVQVSTEDGFLKLIKIDKSKVKYKTHKKNVHRDVMEFFVPPRVPPQQKVGPSDVEDDSNLSTELPQCRSCFEHKFEYVINNENICDGGNESGVDILILISTTFRNKLKRDAIRETWLSVSQENTQNIRYAFLLGFTPDLHLQQQLELENIEYRDIIQEDFIDSYRNLTHKTVMAFKWATTFCNHSRFFMKTDDDMYVNTRNLLEIVATHNSDLQTSVGGTCMGRGKPHRNQHSKYYASVESYPLQHYPGFCSGTGYITSMNAAVQIYEMSKNIKFFHLEDVYIGLCVWKLGMRFLTIRGFSIEQVKPRDCHYKNSKMVTSHGVPPNLMRGIWKMDCTKHKVTHRSHDDAHIVVPSMT